MVQIQTFLAYVVLSGLLAFTPTKIWGKSPFDASKRSTLSFWEYQQKRENKLFPAYINTLYNGTDSDISGICGIIGSFGVYADKNLGEESFRRFKEIYALILGIPAEESKDYCLFKLEGETVELYFIEVENEYSIIVVYTIL